MFSTTRKQAQQIAQHLIAGHCGLIAWWALRHAGVLQAMRELGEKSGEGLEPAAHAAQTNMSPEVLQALLEYLADTRLVVFRKNGVHLTPDGYALLDNEDGVLQLFRGYQGVLEMTEHLLAKLKITTGANGAGIRKSEYLLESQSKRYAAEVFPAIADLITKQKLTHVLDITCGTGELLVHLAGSSKRVVGVGIGPEGEAIRRANAAITATGLEARFIAVTANPLDACTQTERIFDRIGISRQLWKEIDCIVAMNLFGELTARPEELARVLEKLPKNFPGARLMLIEPVASTRLERNYYAAEHMLLLRLAGAVPWPVEKWRATLEAAGLAMVQEVPLTTDGLTIFLCKSEAQAPPAVKAGSARSSPTAVAGP